MRAKFTLLVAAMALGLAALAPTASAETVSILNEHEEQLPKETLVTAISHDFGGSYGFGAGQIQIYCETAIFPTTLIEAENPIELEQTEEGTLENCYQKSPWSEIPITLTNLELDYFRINSNATGEAWIRFTKLHNEPGDNYHCTMEGSLDIAVTSLLPAQLGLNGTVNQGVLPACYYPIKLDFDVKLYDSEGDPLAIQIS